MDWPVSDTNLLGSQLFSQTQKAEEICGKNDCRFCCKQLIIRPDKLQFDNLYRKHCGTTLYNNNINNIIIKQQQTTTTTTSDCTINCSKSQLTHCIINKSYKLLNILQCTKTINYTSEAPPLICP